MTLAADIDPTIHGPEIRKVASLGSKAFFTNADNDVFVSDGTEVGTRFLLNALSNEARDLTPAGGLVYFNNGSIRQLWRSDGTPEGTFALTGVTGYQGTLWRGVVDAGGGVAYVIADRGLSARELWRTDGTIEGTRPVTNGQGPQYKVSVQSNLTVVGDTVYFVGSDPAHGLELWKSNGTEQGTVLVKDIRPGTSSSVPSQLRNLNGTLLFSANDDVSGTELWRSDGTEAGTTLVADVRPGPTGSSPTEAEVAGQRMFFAADDGQRGSELWVTDGTPGGTALAADILPGPTGSAPAGLKALGGSVVFGATDGKAGREPWISDGTPQGTSLLGDLNAGPADSSPDSFTAALGKLFFRAGTPQSGMELWATDGTSPGTGLVRDVHPGPTSSGLNYLSGAADRIYFAAFDPLLGMQLRISDGTAEGTRAVTRHIWIAQGSSPQQPFEYNSNLFFHIGFELWRSDGTAAGTRPTGVPYGTSTAVLGDWAYLASGNNLIRTDGTPAGTTTLKTFDQRVAELTAIDGALYFAAGQGGTGYELWTSDGTPEGTMLVKEIHAGADPSSPQKFTGAAGRVFFIATDLEAGTELWQTDGTAAGTTRVKDMTPGASGSGFHVLSTSAGKLYMAVDAAGLGSEVWVSDGTESGTRPVKDIYPGTGSAFIRPEFNTPQNRSRFRYFAEANGLTLFGARDGVSTYALWATDGTEAGTRKIADDPAGIYPGSFTHLGDSLIFASVFPQAPGGPLSLWRTDGTTAGTVKLKELGSSRPEIQLTSAGEVAYLKVGNSHGRVIWATDGTPEGTQELAVPTGMDVIEGLTAVAGTVFFSGWTADIGTELWMLPTSVLPSAPTNFSAAVDVGGRVSLSWQDTSGNETGFRVERSLTPDFAAIDATALVAPNAASYVDAQSAGLTRYYRVVAYNPAGASQPSASVVGGPLRVAEARFDNSRIAHASTIRFGGATAAPLTVADMSVVNVTSGQAVADGNMAFSYDGPTLTWTLSFPGLADGSLSDGRYRLTIPEGAIADLSARLLDGDGDGSPGGDFVFDFAQYAGDVDGDGKVDFDDLAILAQSYNTSGRTRSQGDLNYDGSVDFNDLAILAQRYNTGLPPLATPPPGPASAAVAAANVAPMELLVADSQLGEDDVRGRSRAVTTRAPKPVFAVKRISGRSTVRRG